MGTYTNQGRALANARRLAASGVAEGVTPIAQVLQTLVWMVQLAVGKVIGYFVVVSMS